MTKFTALGIYTVIVTAVLIIIIIKPAPKPEILSDRMQACEAAGGHYDFFTYSGGHKSEVCTTANKYITDY